MTEETWDAIVAGGGPAGLSAALMLGRARRRVLVIDAGSPRNRFAAHMHGVLGREGTPPHELLAIGRDEVAAYGVAFVNDPVTGVEAGAAGLSVTTGDGAVRTSRTLVLATGLRDELPPIPGLAERWGTTVLHCPYCHGWEVRDRRLGVLLTSPLGLHQAELIRQWSDRVTVFAGALGALAPDAERRLRARGVDIVLEPAVEIVGDGTAISAVRLRDGRAVPVEAVFTAGAPRPHDEVVGPLGLDRTETPFGSFLAVDPMGRTTHERIWAIGNVVDPGANVPLSIGTGSMAGAAVNAALVGWDTDAAVADADLRTPSGNGSPDGMPRSARGSEAWPQVAPADYWEERYAGAHRVWSGRVNRVLADTAGALPPGRALDLGCGEGADVVWLAQHGWEAMGADISPTAVRRATDAAHAAGLDGRARFVASDLADLPPGAFDLVTASFLHSPVELRREDILGRAKDAVALGGHLLVTSHAAPPPWSSLAHHHGHRFATPEEELAGLALDPESWEVVLAETRTRETTGPDGAAATLDDVVVLVRRRS